MKLNFTEIGWKEYVYWQTGDKKTLKKVNSLLDDIARNQFEGIGKPEPLKGELSGRWSRRIDGEHRLVYEIKGDTITIHRCKGHY